MQVIFSADDFGSSASVNAAVARASREGVLTSASLMVTGEAVGEAVALVRANLTLAVGLHIVLARGRSALPRKAIPHLVNGADCFRSSGLTAGLYYAVSRAAQKELGRELVAQFEAFAATGLPLSHVDGHLNIHVHPAVLSLLLPLAQAYGAKGFRVPRDDFRLAVSYDRRRLAHKASWAVVYDLLARWSVGRLKQYPLSVTRRVYGLMQSGEMSERYVTGLLRRIDVPTAEIYFHPSITAGAEPLGPNPGDLATLLSPAVRDVIAERGLRPATYATLAEGR